MDHEVAEFAQPDSTSIIDALRTGLALHFETVQVDLVTCPDLSALGVASSGMTGSTALFEFGGEPYAHNPRYRGANAAMDVMIEASGIPDAKIFGAAMADVAAIDGNCGEMIANADFRKENRSRVARVGADRQCVVERYGASTCGPIANLFVSEGCDGEVIGIDLRKRIGDEISLTQAIRSSLTTIVQGDGHIGMGGVFELLAGKIRSHVMPNYDCIEDGYYDIEKEKVVRDFLQFYEYMGPGLLLFCTLWTGDPSGGTLNLRPSGEHTHFYHRDDAAQQAGHYHGDVTPDEVHYRGYISLADRIFRFGDIYKELGLRV